jgi:hypothetical protein
MNFRVMLSVSDDTPGAIEHCGGIFLPLEGQAAIDWHKTNRDASMKITKNGAPMTSETRKNQLALNRTPRENTKPGRRYDEIRACEYMRQLTGINHDGAGWEADRIRFVWGDDGVKRQIPHWDWSGHLQTVEECEVRETHVRELADVFA